jgi:hypothetical protein
LTLYFSRGIIGGIVQVLGGLIWPSHFGTAVVGASAGGMGLMAAFAVLYPEQLLTMLLFYFFPITLRAKYLLWGIVALSFICIIFPASIFALLFGQNVSNAAHLGGMAMGIFYVRQILQGRWFHFKNPLRRESPLESADGKGKKRSWSSAVGNDEDFSTAEFLQTKVDPILEKISAHGIQSLTAREKQILEKAREKMAKR